MSTLLAQLILAGRSEDTEGWMSILVVVVLAVFWAVSGIVKATAKKPQDGQRQQPPRKPPRRVSPPTTARDPSSARPATATTAQPRPRAARLLAELEKALRSASAPAPAEPALPLPTPQVEAARQELPDIASKPLKAPERMRLAVPEGTPQEEDLPELEFDYADPDELSKAILHYEILGRPLSLRDPSGDIAGF